MAKIEQLEKNQILQGQKIAVLEEIARDTRDFMKQFSVKFDTLSGLYGDIKSNMIVYSDIKDSIANLGKEIIAIKEWKIKTEPIIDEYVENKKKQTSRFWDLIWKVTPAILILILGLVNIKDIIEIFK